MATPEGAGAPVVAHTYADGQRWDDAWFTIPQGSVRVEATLNHQRFSRHYIEALRDGNITDDWGQVLHDLWDETGRGAPVIMAHGDQSLRSFVAGDVDLNCRVDGRDLQLARKSLGLDWTKPGFEPRADIDGDHAVERGDLQLLKARIGAFCRPGEPLHPDHSVSAAVEP